MALSNYQIVIISCVTGNAVAVYDASALFGLQYSRLLNDIGRVVFTISPPADAEEIFALDNFIEVYRTNPATGLLVLEETYLTRLTHRYVDGNVEKFTVGGLSLNHLLQRRIIDPDDDPLEAGGYSTKGGPADTVMFEYAEEQAVSPANTARIIPGLSIAPVANSGETVGARLRFEPLFDVLKDLGVRGGMDFHIYRRSSINLELVITPMGVDRTQTSNYPGAPFVRLDPRRANLESPSLRIDRQGEGNFVYLQGQGQGSNRIVLEQSASSILDSPLNRIEFTAEARNVEKGNGTDLITAAQAELKKRERLVEFTFEPVANTAGNVYRVDYDVADYITVGWDNFSQDLRVIGVEISLDSQRENLQLITEIPDEGT